MSLLVLTFCIPVLFLRYYTLERHIVRAGEDGEDRAAGAVNEDTDLEKGPVTKFTEDTTLQENVSEKIVPKCSTSMDKGEVEVHEVDVEHQRR